MKRYNRDKRAIYNARNKNIQAYDRCDAQDKRTRIHISIQYDGYAQTTYMPIIHRKTRNTHAQRYVNTTNAINNIFPDINAPHNARTYRATAPYRKYPKRDTRNDTIIDNINITELHERAYKWYNTVAQETHGEIYKDKRRARCIIYNGDKIIHMDVFVRERIIDTHKHTITTILHRNDRSLEVYDHIISPDAKIYNHTVREIKAQDVEIYNIRPQF